MGTRRAPVASSKPARLRTGSAASSGRAPQSRSHDTGASCRLDSYIVRLPEGLANSLNVSLIEEGVNYMSTVNQEPVTPNQYHLHGHGISVSYFPEGVGPILKDRGSLRFTYQDSFRALSFYGDEVRTVNVPDLGTIVSVTIVQTVDTGSTSASLLVPIVVLPAQSSSAVPIHTDLITTIHRFFVTAIGHPQREVYSVTALTGVAALGPLPL